MASSVSKKMLPRYILRAHQCAVHSIKFLGNLRLLTGDAEGWVILWDLVSKRPKTVWRAHTEPVLKVDAWGFDKVVTHGRDHKLLVWDVTPDDEKVLDPALPLEKAAEARRKPSLVHSLDVNALNFCAFSLLHASSNDVSSSGSILFAVPNSLDSEAIDIIQLPSKTRIYERIGKSSTKTGDASRLANTSEYHSKGICMALHLRKIDGRLSLIAGYESGHVKAFALNATTALSGSSDEAAWEEVYSSKCHSQPVLSLDVDPLDRSFYTSSADAQIIQHLLPSVDGDGLFKYASDDSNPKKIINTHHSGQQSLTVRSDGRIFATAGWDSKARVYSTKNMKELAVLKWHKEGCYAVALGDVHLPDPASSAGSPGSAGAMVRESHVPETDIPISTGEHRRTKATSEIHWLAIGSKDGKVSLWEVY